MHRKFPSEKEEQVQIWTTTCHPLGSTCLPGLTSQQDSPGVGVCRTAGHGWTRWAGPVGRGTKVFLLHPGTWGGGLKYSVFKVVQYIGGGQELWRRDVFMQELVVCCISCTCTYVQNACVHRMLIDSMIHQIACLCVSLVWCIRDGSAVEIVGLCKSIVRWLAKLYSRGIYHYSGVSLASTTQPSGRTSPKKKHLSYADWNKLLQQSFEAKFWIPEALEEGQQKEGDEAPYIHRTGIYKDSYRASQQYADFQLRPNFAIAVVVVS